MDAHVIHHGSSLDVHLHPFLVNLGCPSLRCFWSPLDVHHWMDIHFWTSLVILHPCCPFFLDTHPGPPPTPPWGSDMIGQRTRSSSKCPPEGRVSSGKETLRLRAQGPATLQEGVRHPQNPCTSLGGRVSRGDPTLGIPSPPTAQHRGGRGRAPRGRPAGELHGHPRLRAGWVLLCAPPPNNPTPTSPPDPAPPAAATMVEMAKCSPAAAALACALDSVLGEFAFPQEFVAEVWAAVCSPRGGQE